ncbi:EAL domain-containing protein [Thalassospira sp. HF15]|uniref:GGDEF/EAL domain-containing response regulator n=1 Tax=Thalassospira sp. HF15 TaxID=2722755 RepID=UPI001431365B|nr:EAL domain-containing protein [Thalassospira sp. HF15]NIY74738.1 EAL domain-containing protein [Thalassospira sp. HF15]
MTHEQGKKHLVDPATIETWLSKTGSYIEDVPKTDAKWRILVVDDDTDVHEATDYALSRVKILGRSLELIHAYSAGEGLEILHQETDIAVILLDVVMERPDSGLRLVEEIRAEGYREQRIILRTGYPGDAPEKEVIRNYEVDDYWSKDELTRTRLVTSLTTAIRAVDYIRALKGTRAGLEMVIEGTQHLYQNKNLDLFAEGVLTQLAAILRVSPAGGICALAELPDSEDELVVLSGTGRFAPHVGSKLFEVDEIDKDLIHKSLRNGQGPVVSGDKMVFSHQSDTGRRLLIYFVHEQSLSRQDIVLTELFVTNLAICFDNLALITELGELAFVDQRVGIPNQNAFDRELMNVTRGDSNHTLVAMVAIEDAAELVVAFGVNYFEEIMNAVYQRLHRIAGNTVLVARVAEYTLGLVDSTGKFEVSAAENIFDEPFEVAGSPVVVRATIGVVRGNPQGRRSSDIQRAARLTLLKQKQKGPGGTAEFESSMADDVQDSLRLIGKLRQAVQDRVLTFVFQPKIRLASERVVGYEVLCRWTDDGVPVSPGRFIPLAERAGLSDDITFQCLEAVSDLNRSLQQENLPALKAAVNLAAHDIGNMDFVEQLLEACHRLGLGPELICFEITETQHFTNDGDATACVQKLAEEGFELWLDDFGTGYSSLTHLDILPVCGIKIDKSFISVLSAENHATHVAETAAGIAQTLGIDCVAEGIETREQHKFCQSLGVEFAQGFLYSAGLAPDKFVAWLKDWNLNGRTNDDRN